MSFLGLNLAIPTEPRIWYSIALCGFISAFGFIKSTITKNYSFVDRSWSILPILYAWVLCDFKPRTIVMSVLITFWGLRLTWNFYRKGGYEPGEQDYRWPILRLSIKNDFAWHLFNFGFISYYQNALLLAISMPGIVELISIYLFDANTSLGVY